MIQKPPQPHPSEIIPALLLSGLEGQEFILLTDLYISNERSELLRSAIVVWTLVDTTLDWIDHAEETQIDAAAARWSKSV